MAALRKRASGRWQAVVRDPSGKRHSETFDTKAAARAWGQDQEHRMRAGTFRDPSLGRITVDEWVKLWQRARVVEKSTAAKDGSWLRNHILPTWGAWPLADIQRMDVQGWVKRLERDGVGAATIEGASRLFSTILGEAVENGRRLTNPAVKISTPTVPRKRERYLTLEESEKLLEATSEPTSAAARARGAAEMTSGEPWRCMWLLTLYTGMRWQELAGLQVHSLDLLRRRLTVQDALLRDGTLQPYPKSDAGHRTLPLTERVVDALAVHLQEHPRTGLVFRGERGGPLSYTNVRSRIWVPTIERAKLAAPLPTIHDLRHTYASWMVQAGVDLRTVMYLMGHAKITTTMRYAHLAPDAGDRALAALDAHLTPEVAQQKGRLSRDGL